MNVRYKPPMTTFEEIFVILMLGTLVLCGLWHFAMPSSALSKPVAKIVKTAPKAQINYTMLAIANTLFWECRGEPLSCKRLVATTIWTDANRGDTNLYIEACLDSDRYRAWKEHDMTVSRLCAPVLVGDPEYPAWRECVAIAHEMLNGSFNPIGIYETDENDMPNGNVLYPTFFHARDGKHRDWTPKNAMKMALGNQTYYFEEVEK